MNIAFLSYYVGENNKSNGQSTTIKVSINERKTSIYFISKSDEEGHSARKRMWKITSGIYMVFFLRIALKRPYNKYYLLTESEVITGKSQTEALMY